jgi:hypothetical protein
VFRVTCFFRRSYSPVVTISQLKDHLPISEPSQINTLVGNSQLRACGAGFGGLRLSYDIKGVTAYDIVRDLETPKSHTGSNIR